MAEQILPYTLDDWVYYFEKEETSNSSNSTLFSIDLELSRKCNLNCGYCYSDAGDALENELKIDEIIKLIKEVKKIGLKSITIVGGGEPLLVDYLDDLINFLYHNNLRCAIVTNGTFLDEEKAKFLFAKGVSLCVKVNSISNPEIFEYMVGNVKGVFERVHNAIALLLSVGYTKQNGPHLAIESVVCKKNRYEIPDLWRWARNNNVLPIIELVTPQGRAKNNKDFLMSKEEAKEIFNLLRRIDKNEYNLKWESLPSIAGSPCKRLYYSCYITATGEVRPCAGIDIGIGNIRENSLHDILMNSQLLTRLRNPHLYLKGKCGQCELKKHCYGCRGKAFWATGDPLGEDPICWR